MRRVIALGCIMGVGAFSAPAMGQVVPPADHPADSGVPSASRVVVGFIGGRALGNLSAATPGGGDQRGVGATGGLVAAYERRIFDSWSLGGAASVSDWTAGAGVDVGYRYLRFDLGVAPRCRIIQLPSRGILSGDIDVALPVGLTRPYVSAPSRRAFTETIRGQLGWYWGGELGATLLFQRWWGFRFEVGYSRHSSGTRTTITPTDPAQNGIVTENRAVDHQLLFTFGVVFAF